jgi:hypothetical protein
MIWKRLDSRYGSPEKVEMALKVKINSILKLSNNDKTKMIEQSDILSEIKVVTGVDINFKGMAVLRVY